MNFLYCKRCFIFRILIFVGARHVFIDDENSIISSEKWSWESRTISLKHVQISRSVIASCLYIKLSKYMTGLDSIISASLSSRCSSRDGGFLCGCRILTTDTPNPCRYSQPFYRCDLFNYFNESESEKFLSFIRTVSYHTVSRVLRWFLYTH